MARGRRNDRILARRVMSETTVSTIVAERVMTVDTDPRARPLPQTTMQLVGHTSGAVVDGLSRTPMALAVICLNIIGIGAAVYFLNLLISGQQQHLKALLDVQDKQQTELITLHRHEFDSLLALLPKNEAIPPITPQPAPAAPTPGRAR